MAAIEEVLPAAVTSEVHHQDDTTTETTDVALLDLPAAAAAAAAATEIATMVAAEDTMIDLLDVTLTIEDHLEEISMIEPLPDETTTGGMKNLDARGASTPGMMLLLDDTRYSVL